MFLEQKATKRCKDCIALKWLKLQRNQNSPSSIFLNTDQNMRCKIPLTKILNWTAGCELWSGRPYCRPWSVPWAAGLWVMGLLWAKPIKALVRYTFSNRTPPTLLQHSDVDPATKCEPLAKWCLSWRYSWTLPL